MFRSGSGKRQSSATNSPNASDERQQKSIGTSTTKTTVSIGTSTPSKGKTWRRIKSGNGTSNTTKKSSKPTAPSPVDGGFVQRDETATPMSEEIPAVPQPVQPTEQESQELEPLPPPPIEDMHMEQPPLPPPPPKSAMESLEVTQHRVPSIPFQPRLKFKLKECLHEVFYSESIFLYNIINFSECIQYFVAHRTN